MKPFILYKSLTLVITMIILISCSTDNNQETNSSTVSATGFSLTIDENPGNNFVLGEIVANTDEGSLTYYLYSEDPDNAIDVDRDNGIVTVKDSILFNFEKHPLITGTIKVTNGEVTKDTFVRITVNDIYEQYSYIGSKSLSTQQQINDFGSENHWGVSGTLSINGNKQGDKLDISPLSSIISVGTLSLNDLNISSGTFENINDVKNLRINGLTNISSLVGLHNITSLSGRLTISYNHISNNLMVLSELTSIGEDLRIYQNNALQSLDGLNNVLEIGGNLILNNHSSLFTIYGLSSLQNIVGDIEITDNGLLYDFCGFETLINSNGINGNYLVENNFYNPTHQDLIDGNCSN